MYPPLLANRRPLLSPQAVRSVSLLSPGFLQLPLRSLGPEAELLLSFTTNNQSGVLLAVLGDQRHDRQVRWRRAARCRPLIG